MKKKIIILSIGIVALVTGIALYNFYVSYKNSCFGGNGNDCYAKSLHYASLNMPDTAALSAKEACKLGVYEGCLDYGDYQNAKGVISESREYLERACELNKSVCYKMAVLEYSLGETDKAIKLSSKLCNEHEDPDGCMVLGGILVSSSNPYEGISYLSVACKKGRGEACFMLATHYSNIDDRKSYKHYLSEACDLDLRKACQRLDMELR